MIYSKFSFATVIVISAMLYKLKIFIDSFYILVLFLFSFHFLLRFVYLFLLIIFQFFLNCFIRMKKLNKKNVSLNSHISKKKVQSFLLARPSCCSKIFFFFSNKPNALLFRSHNCYLKRSYPILLDWAKGFKCFDSSTTPVTTAAS